MSIAKKDQTLHGRLRRQYPNWNEISDYEKITLESRERWRMTHPNLSSFEDFLSNIIESLPKLFLTENRKYTIIWASIMAIVIPGIFLIVDGGGRGFSQDIIKYMLWVFIVLVIGATLLFTVGGLNQRNEKENKRSRTQL